MAREKILLTPKVAQDFLSHNYEKNRKVRALAVNKIAQDILNSRWDSELSRYQDPILITKDGTLINGQHRCLAVVLTGHAVETYVEYDVPKSIYRMLDGATVRGAADFVDVPNKNNAAALAKIMCAVEDSNVPLASALQGKVAAKVQATRSQVIEKINSSNDRIQRLIKAGQRMGIYLYNRKTYISTALFLIDYTGRDDVMERFVYEASQMTTESQPINALRAYMGKCIANKNFKSDYKWAVSCILYAYEAFRNGTEIRNFNKTNIIFSKYDKYVFETRESKRRDNKL